jgi:uncharacterized membrane protein (DUF4010 family)
LWKLFGARGIEFAGFLGGLVNSTVTVTELSSRVALLGKELVGVAYRGVLFSTAAMALRNALLLGLLERRALVLASGSLGLMLFVSGALGLLAPRGTAPEGAHALDLKSPFSLLSALKFGLIFLALQVLGTLAQALFGHAGFYVISLFGGLVSSASAVAAAATLSLAGKISVLVAGIGAVLASLASAAVNIVLVARISKSPVLTRQVALATGCVLVLGLIGAVLTSRFAPAWL